MATSIAPSAPSRPAFVPTSAPTDDGLLGEIDYAMQLRSAAELRALDEFTPLADPALNPSVRPRGQTLNH